MTFLICGILPEMVERLGAFPCACSLASLYVLSLVGVAPGNKRIRWGLEVLLKAKPGLTLSHPCCPSLATAFEGQPRFQRRENRCHVCREEYQRVSGHRDSGTQGKLMGTLQEGCGGGGLGQPRPRRAP